MAQLLILALWPFPVLTRADLAIMRAQEQFVQAIPGTTPPEPCPTAAIAGLGNPQYYRRRLAAKRLTSATVRDPRWLFWFNHLRDPEVRMRARVIARDVLGCPECRGTGQCPGKHTIDRGGWLECQRCGYNITAHWGQVAFIPSHTSMTRCWDCDGTGWLHGIRWIEDQHDG